MAKSIVLVTQGKQQYMHIITNVAYRKGYSPYIDENNMWVVYDDDLKQYVTTEIYAKGNIGPQGDKGETGDSYILTPEDITDIATLINERELDVVKNNIRVEPVLNNNMLSFSIGTVEDAETGSIEVVTSVGEIASEDEQNGG